MNKKLLATAVGLVLAGGMGLASADVKLYGQIDVSIDGFDDEQTDTDDTNLNSNTIAANIALQFPEAAGLAVNRLIATGLVLFLITFAVNALARRIASAGFSGAEG